MTYNRFDEIKSDGIVICLPVKVYHFLPEHTGSYYKQLRLSMGHYAAINEMKKYRRYKTHFDRQTAEMIASRVELIYPF
jgi:hypothetical protein